ncbi:MAG: cupredoxin domain-containing protein [Alphaproteobacteria bacterium]|nr:cupredoxin domain-containing protein [Alphaproteobacteria bacterium]
MRKSLIALTLVMLAGIGNANAADYTITSKDGKFDPAAITVPAGQKIKLTVKNESKDVVEFESYDLDREQKIQPGESTDIYVGPLNAGEYPFFDDKNEDAKGTITAQ